MDHLVTLPTREVKVALRLATASPKPIAGQIFLTRRCNLNCPFCAAPLHKSSELSPSAWCEILDRLHVWGVRVLNFVGGEPTLYKGLWDVLAHAKRRGFITVLHSNLHRTPADFSRRLLEAGVYGLEASLDSLDGSLPKSDLKILGTLNELRDRGVLPLVCSVLTSQNHSAIPEIAELTTAHGIPYVLAVYQSVGGRFSSGDAKLAPEPDDLRRVFSRLIEIKQRTHLVKNSFGFLENSQLHIDRTWHCDATADHWLAVDADGTLMPCQEFRSTLGVMDLQETSIHRNETWRNEKARVVGGCHGCTYQCYVDGEHAVGARFLREIGSYVFALWTAGRRRRPAKLEGDGRVIPEVF